MKKNLFFWVAFASLLCVASCIKREIRIPPPPSGNDSTVSVNDTDAALILRPDSTTGQDCYVSKLDTTPDGNTNLNWTHEIVMSRWSLSQYNYDTATQRSYIRFDNLAKIPSTATVTSAVLYLYGEDSSITFPYGNSYYPYSNNPPNPVLVQQVIGGTWDQKTITWNNAPALTSVGQDTIPASTSEWNYNASVDVTNLVKKMVASPSTNYGFGLRLVTENIYRDMLFSTCEVTDSIRRPRLVVRYH
ncbi:MAG TPA: DNRLRE domain-containing protein [Puia sp.]|nr:DNRLRE domain-containing protein [Puia sp.]